MANIRMSVEEFKQACGAKKDGRRKYRNKPVTVDGIRFASKREANRYGELKIQLTAKRISDLRTHTRWDIVVNGVHICRYEDDFSYNLLDSWGGVAEFVVEDTKGFRTPEYKLKRQLMLAVHGINVVEI